MASWSGGPEPEPRSADDLEKLAAELDNGQFEAHVVTPLGRRPRLSVRNRQAVQLTENIYADTEWFYWGWAEKISPVADVAAAAAAIGQVLRTIGDRQ